MTDWIEYMKKLFWGEKASQQSFEYVKFDRTALYSKQVHPVSSLTYMHSKLWEEVL